MRIVFMGTPTFAVPSLAILVENGYDIAAVVTTPDKAAGRGYKLTPSAVKKYALSQNLKVLQPKRLRSKSFVAALKELQADLFYVVAFRILPPRVYQIPPLGSVNLHGSLLPHYRGAAPINWAVINGEVETGLTTFFIDKQVDTGEMIFQKTTPIASAETAGQLHDRLMEMGAKLTLKTVRALETNNYQRIRQQWTKSMKKAPKIFREDCQINWNAPTAYIYNFIRGLNPYPAAFTKLKNGKALKIFSTQKRIQAHNLPPASIYTNHKTFLHIATKDGFIEVQELQLQGKRRMEIRAFLRGYRKELEIVSNES